MTLVIWRATASEAETIALGERLGSVLVGGDVVLLSGDLGAGKTRFAKGVARGQQVAQALTSPTFNLVLEYPLAGGERVLRHFDLYRLEDADQLEDIDYFGLIEDEHAISLVEWGDRFASALPVDYLMIRIELTGTDAAASEQRAIQMSAHGESSEAALARFKALEEAGALHE